MSDQRPEGDDGTGRFDYFMIRLSRTARQPDRVAGMVERLGSGEKRSFETGEQLVRLVGGWATPGFNMPIGADDGNAVPAEADGSISTNEA